MNDTHHRDLECAFEGLALLGVPLLWMVARRLPADAVWERGLLYLFMGTTVVVDGALLWHHWPCTKTKYKKR